MFWLPQQRLSTVRASALMASEVGALVAGFRQALPIIKGEVA
jgi:hypothetical protein